MIVPEYLFHVSKNLVRNRLLPARRKQLVIVSDDWGSIRVESRSTQAYLRELGITIDSNRFDKFDSLERKEDLEELFNVLLKHKDSQGRHPVITAFCNVANPDFDKISKSGFTEYAFEPFTETLKRRDGLEDVLRLYKEGISKGIFIPQFHGREHINIRSWIKNLQESELARKAFEVKYFMLGKKYLPSKLKYGNGAAFDLFDSEDLVSQSEVINSGLSLFKNIFDYKASFFAAPSLIYSDKLIETITANEIRGVDVSRIRKQPLGEGKYATSFHYTGQKASIDLSYVVRNAVFEPNMRENSDGVDSCMARIARAFSWGSPAIISNHRAAFVGSLSTSNRVNGIAALDRLLSKILRYWPDVSFCNLTDLDLTK